MKHKKLPATAANQSRGAPSLQSLAELTNRSSYFKAVVYVTQEYFTIYYNYRSSAVQMNICTRMLVVGVVR